MIKKTEEFIDKYIVGEDDWLLKHKDVIAKLLDEYEAEQCAMHGFSISSLTEILKSDSVHRLLRYGVKSPSSSGMDDCDDDSYYDLYKLVCELRNH